MARIWTVLITGATLLTQDPVRPVAAPARQLSPSSSRKSCTKSCGMSHPSTNLCGLRMAHLHSFTAWTWGKLERSNCPSHLLTLRPAVLQPTAIICSAGKATHFRLLWTTVAISTQIALKPEFMPRHLRPTAHALSHSRHQNQSMDVSHPFEIRTRNQDMLT